MARQKAVATKMQQLKITQDILDKAAELAATEYDDQWFAIDVCDTGKSSEPGTVIFNYQGQNFEVWLTKYWHSHQ
jgi:hypothetical protein